MHGCLTLFRALEGEGGEEKEECPSSVTSLLGIYIGPLTLPYLYCSGSALCNLANQYLEFHVRIPGNCN